MSKVLLPPKIVGLNPTQQDFLRYQLESFGQREPWFFALELCGECGELANLEKKLQRDPANPPQAELIAKEAADVFIALINYCNSRNIDLEHSVQEKLAEIEIRRHQGKMGKTL